MIVTVSRGKESTYMKMFTIDTDNNITVHTSRKAARETGAGVFATEEQFADLIGPDNKRLVEIWNSLAGVKAVTKFANRKAATERIWKALQIVYSDAKLADDWVKRSNSFFGGQTPLERMSAGDVTDLAAVRAYIDAARAPWA